MDCKLMPRSARIEENRVVNGDYVCLCYVGNHVVQHHNGQKAQGHPFLAACKRVVVHGVFNSNNVVAMHSGLMWTSASTTRPAPR